MKKWCLGIMLVLAVGLMTSCGGVTSRLHVPGNPDQVNNVYNSVVAMVRMNNGYFRGSYCTAFFVGPQILATAAHCVHPPRTRIITLAGATPILPVPIPQAQSLIGQTVRFVTHQQYIDWIHSKAERNNPETTLATVVIVDTENNHDVVLLELALGENDTEHWFEMRDLERDPLRVGEEVYSVGMPVRQIWILTDGIISRVHIRLNSTIDILHQVRIGPGSSGSPLIDHQGRVIGVNSAGWGSPRTGTVLGQAKPISYVQTMIRILEVQREIEELDRRFEEQHRNDS